MKKTNLLILCLFLSACGTTVFHKFDGEKIEQGKGGVISTQYGDVLVYIQGLPSGKSCSYKGMVQDQRLDDSINNAYQSESIQKISKENGVNTLVLAKRKNRSVWKNDNSVTIQKKGQFYDAYYCE